MLSQREAAEEEWEFYRKEIQTLYVVQEKTLKDVMSYMKEQYNFDATWEPKDLC